MAQGQGSAQVESRYEAGNWVMYDKLTGLRMFTIPTASYGLNADLVRTLASRPIEWASDKVWFSGSNLDRLDFNGGQRWGRRVAGQPPWPGRAVADVRRSPRG